MDKIPFEDGKKIKNATVTINEQEYEVTPAQYQGTTPMSAFNLNKMQDNIENTLVKVSATEPNPKADVWIKHCKNMFKTLPNTTTINGITFTNNGDGTIIANGTATAEAYITIDKRNLQSNKYALSGCPVGGGQDKYSIYMTDTSTWSNIAQDFGNGANFNLDSLKNIETRLRVAAGVTVNNLVFKPQLEIGEQTKFTPYFEDDIFVNDNGVYNSVINKKENYNPTFDTTYITVSTETIKFCSVINKVAYISLELTLKAVSLSNQQVKLVTGLPKAIANFNDIGYLFRNTALYKTLRFRINSGGELISWYNSAIKLQVNDVILLNISYPVQ